MAKIEVPSLLVALTVALSSGAPLVASCAANDANQPPQMAQLAQAITPPEREGPPEPLSPVTRALLKERMASHAQDMSDLVSAIMLLEYPRIAERSEKIADDASLSRPTSKDATELNASIPEKFFVRQDDLRTAARDLASSARVSNPFKVAGAYGRLSETCVRCHADYRPRD